MASADMYRGIAIGALAGAGAYACLSQRSPPLSQAPSTKSGSHQAKPITPAASDQDISTTSSGHTGDVYETDRAVAEYLQFHFGRDKDLMPYDDGPREALAFASRTADLCQRWVDKLQLPKNAAFDVGCAVGRTSFDLSKSFKSVLGLDFSHKFIDTANKLKSGTEIEYSTVTEGDGRTTYTCAAPKDARPERITFIQGDACNLPAGIGPFSVIQGSNLLCRLPDPVKFLESLPAILEPGGLVVLVSPYSWLEQYTPRNKWLGGFIDRSGAVKDSFTGLQEVMERLGFKLVHRENMQFLIREHVRKFSLGVSDGTVWQLQPSK